EMALPGPTSAEPSLRTSRARVDLRCSQVCSFRRYPFRPVLGPFNDRFGVHAREPSIRHEMLAGDPYVGHVIAGGSVNQLRERIENGSHRRLGELHADGIGGLAG